jgi:hypothetical protein
MSTDGGNYLSKGREKTEVPPEYFSKTWNRLSWTDWIPLDAPVSAFRQIPTSASVYRIRPVGHIVLAYIGQTQRGLRERLRMLSLHTYVEEMPFNDPHTAAQSLWVLRIENEMAFECSAAPVALNQTHLRGLEDMLLWKHRIESGQSTLCNYGRFHPNYRRSGNRGSGQQGGKLPPGQINPASGSCSQPLQLVGKPQDGNWMGLNWSPPGLLSEDRLRSVPDGSGLYKLFDPTEPRLLYIGETEHLQKRLVAHRSNSWEPYQPLFSFYQLPDGGYAFQRHELESDLLGSHYLTFREPPVFQYTKQAKQALT